MNRFFAFGCSFTNFAYPTYADILSLNFDHYQNWGRGGSGNHFIFNSIIEANQRHNFSTDDTIIVQWTNTGREDRYSHNGWIGDGNIYSQLTYNEDWVKKYITERGCLLRDLAFIQAVYLLLINAKCNFKFISMVPLSKHDEWIDHNNSEVKNNDIYQVYKEVLQVIRPSFYETVYNKQWLTEMYHNGKLRDSHPTPNEHLEYIRKVLPEFIITNKMEEFAEQETIKFLNNQKSNFKRSLVKRF